MLALRINAVSISIAFGFVIGAAILRYIYLGWRLHLFFTGERSPAGIDTTLLYPHPIPYAVILFLIGLYIGGRIIR